MMVLVCYDIADDKRRTRAAKAALAFGDRVQESVYRCDLDPARQRRLQRLLSRAIDPTVDRVRIERIGDQPVWRLGPMDEIPTIEWVL